jgi:putative ABC transport system permease protein
VVGVFDAGGSAFDSEVWCDGRILAQVLKRPENIFQSATVRLASADSFQRFKDAVTSDPRMNVDVIREIDYYAKQSTTMTRLITVLGGLVAAIMAIGAIFGALNTMYSAVAERGREIATMRAVGFSAWNVVLSFLFEALLISFIAGLVGCLAVLPLNGLTTNTMNFQTFSNVAFAFRITLGLLVWNDSRPACRLSPRRCGSSRIVNVMVFPLARGDAIIWCGASKPGAKIVR